MNSKLNLKTIRIKPVIKNKDDTINVFHIYYENCDQTFYLDKFSSRYLINNINKSRLIV